MLNCIRERRRYVAFSVPLLAFINLSMANNLPPTFTKCKRDDNINKCLVDAVNDALQILKSGNDEFKIPILQPLSIDKLVTETGTASINLKQTLTNVKIYDLISTTKIKRYRTNLSKYLIICDSITERIEIIGDYEMTGRILLLPITGSGKVNITLHNTKIEHRLLGEAFKKDSNLYMRLKDYQMSFEPNHVYFHFDNLFNDHRLSQTMNNFLNDNWEIVFDELKGGYSRNLGILFRNISNLLFEKVPMNSIFLL